MSLNPKYHSHGVRIENMRTPLLLSFALALCTCFFFVYNPSIVSTSVVAISTDSNVQKFQNKYGHEISLYTREVSVAEIIDKCNEGFDISTTASMSNSAFQESDCLEELVVKLMSTFTTQEENETLKQLSSIRYGYVGAMSSLFHDYIECSPGCGSIWSGMGTSYYSALLQEMALNIIEHHEDY